MTITVALENYKDDAFNGEIDIRIPTLLDRTRIEQRKAELAGKVNIDQLSANARGQLEVIATLETLIERAPIGFYVDDTGKRPASLEEAKGRPRISFMSADDTLMTNLVAVYWGFQKERERFQGGEAQATGGAVGDSQNQESV